ncbi:hypothetical protein C0992_012480, partial [Termitomyces sp. T32_za158]
MSNPHKQICLDFAGDEYTEAQNTMIAGGEGIDDAAAAAMPIQAWNVTNRAQRTVWDRQVREEEEREATRQREAEEEREREAEVRAQQEQAVANKEQKRNRSKYIEILRCRPPTIPVEIALKYATLRLQKGQYVELWYFMNAGLGHARRSKTLANKDSMVLVTNKEGGINWIPVVNTKEAKLALLDRKLPWEDFTIAVRRMLMAMDAAAWPKQRTSML